MENIILSKKVKDIYESDCKLVYIHGNRQSGKTTTCSQLALLASLNPNTSVLFQADRRGTQLILEYLKQIEGVRIANKSKKCIELNNGSEIRLVNKTNKEDWIGVKADFYIVDQLLNSFIDNDLINYVLKPRISTKIVIVNPINIHSIEGMAMNFVFKHRDNYLLKQ